jgi:tellurite resistance protein TerC
VLVWVGIKMIVSHAVFKIPTAISLGIVVSIIAVSIAASLWVSRGRPTVGAEQTPSDLQPSDPPHDERKDVLNP